MRFDGTIGLGSLINLAAIIGAVVVFVIGYEHRITLVESGQAQMERRMADEESQMVVFQRQLTQLMTLRKTNEFSQAPP